MNKKKKKLKMNVFCDVRSGKPTCATLTLEASSVKDLVQLIAMIDRKALTRMALDLDLESLPATEALNNA